MAEVQPIDPGAVQRPALLALIFRDHLLAAAGVTGEGEAGQGVVLWEHPHGRQGVDAGDEAGGVTAGVADPLALADQRAVELGQLRKAVGPVLRGAVGSGGVDDAGRRILHHAYRLPGSVVRQAQKHQVRFVEEFLPLRRVLALILVDEQQLNVRPGRQTIVNLEAGGALLAVNIYLGFHGASLLIWNGP